MKRIFDNLRIFDEHEHEDEDADGLGWNPYRYFVELGVGPSALEHNTRYLRTFEGWRGQLFD